MVKPLKTFFCINVDIQPANDVIKLFSCTTCVKYEGEGGVGGREAGGGIVVWSDNIQISLYLA